MQCELEGRESSGCLVDGWLEGSRLQQTMGRGRRPFLSIWQLTQGHSKRRKQTSLHTSDVFPSFCSDVDIKDKNGSAGRGREGHKRDLMSLLSWAGSSEVQQRSTSCTRQTALSMAGLGFVAEPAWAVGAWECLVSMDRAADGQRHFSAPTKTDEQWARQLAGRITWSPWFACRSGRVAWKARWMVRTLVFCSWCSRATVGFSLPSVKSTPPPGVVLSVSQEHG